MYTTLGRVNVLMLKRKKEVAYDWIKERLLQSADVDVSRFSENALSSELNMSRTPIREALLQLQAEGFVEILPNRGIVIPDVSVREVNETFALRMALEEFVVREIAGNVQAEWLKQVDDNLELQKAAVIRSDVPEYLVHDKAFHDLFLDRYSNSLINNVARRIRERFFSVGMNVLRSKGSVERSFQEHCAIVEGLRLGDPERTAAAMHQHLLTGKRNVLFWQEHADDGMSRRF